MKEIFKMVQAQDPKAMGEQARYERQMKNLLQVDIAKKMGITQAHYSGLEKGRTKWTRAMVKKFNNAVR